MKLTLIKPNIGRMGHSLYVDEGRMQPLQLGVLAALTPPDVEVTLVDDRMEDVPYDEATDLVAMTVETFTARRAYEISAEYRRRGVPVVLGGFHPTLAPDEAAAHADAIYTGDAEDLWPQVIDDAKRSALERHYVGRPGVPHPRVFVRRDLYRGKGYLPITLMQFGRGCRYACSFCAVSSFFDQQHYLREVREVVREIEHAEAKTIFFVDDNVAASHEALKALCRELIPLKVRWVSQASLDITHDPELLSLMVKSGCLGHVIGFESIDERNLRAMKKAPNVSAFNGYKRELEILRDVGLQTWAAFTLGHDYDTRASIEDTLEFALTNKFAFAAFNILVPYPRTALYAKLAEEGRLLYDGKWWLHPRYRFNYAAFRPALMEPDELTEACQDARAKFNSVGSIVRRMFDFKTHLRSPYRLAVYLGYNPLFRKEVFKKHGMRFGLRE